MSICQNRICEAECGNGYSRSSNSTPSHATFFTPAEVDWRAYVLCVLEQFWRHLLRREVHAVHSTKWSDPRAKLLAGTSWERDRTTILASLELPEDPTAHLDAQVRLLDEAYRHVAEQMGDKGAVTVDEQGRLHFEAISAEPEPSSLVALRGAMGRMLPRVELPEVLLEVASWTGYNEAFTPIGAGSRLENLELSITDLVSMAAD